ncbi:C39 family peptidase [Pseudalkalibacillus berkeleyi]|uniref:C39 family peptidase n=1 Tax=Pseudalkalibacillus berkeleyi TaxID=1069813 RepID=A0ABS9GTW2_9BACL|nr:C39 family peptidase [Pseudalkalibacillus berkeleyi]MCF6136272.1 C39 family peptidase [Pseudalkalibacillus berkeleyi]
MRKISTVMLCAVVLSGCNNAVTISKDSLQSSSVVSQAQKANQQVNKQVMLNVPLVKQLPELPRGCEVTSLSMLLQYAGVKVNKMTLAKEVAKDSTPYKEKDGNIYFGNPNHGFVGNMYDKRKPGYGVYDQPIAELGEKYLPKRIINLTGSDFNEVIAHLQNKKPVWVINNTSFNHLPPQHWEEWHTPQGKMKITYKEHSVLITGFDETYVYFNDPLLGVKNHKIPKEQFQKGWEQMGRHAITFK